MAIKAITTTTIKPERKNILTENLTLLNVNGSRHWTFFCWFATVFFKNFRGNFRGSVGLSSGLEPAFLSRGVMKATLKAWGTQPVDREVLILRKPSLNSVVGMRSKRHASGLFCNCYCQIGELKSTYAPLILVLLFIFLPVIHKVVESKTQNKIFSFCQNLCQINHARCGRCSHPVQRV